QEPRRLTPIKSRAASELNNSRDCGGRAGVGHRTIVEQARGQKLAFRWRGTEICGDLAGTGFALGILPIGKFLRVGKLNHHTGHRCTKAAGT
ncbi:hypothetical protein, partial [Acidovorax sp. SD340]|uniref:hypothetical protein n=1 Tax=Acidovorax sp. SD340 TaxID=1690268 RepID=UPI001EE402F8